MFNSVINAVFCRVPATLDERFVTCKMTDTNLTWNTDNMMAFADKNDSVPLYRDKKIEIMFQKPNNIRLDTCNGGNDANSKVGYILVKTFKLCLKTVCIKIMLHILIFDEANE